MKQKPPPSRHRGVLSRQQRTDRVDSARQELQKFLSTLHPAIRKAFRNPASLTPEEYVLLHCNSEFRAQKDAAYLVYIPLAMQVPEEWNACRRAFPALAKVQESQYRGGIKTRGASRKLHEEREDTIIVERVSQLISRLQPGWDLRERLKNAGGFAGGDEEIKRELLKLEYGDDEIAALMKGRTLRAAAAYCLAFQTGRKPQSVMVSLSRALRASKSTPEQNH